MSFSEVDRVLRTYCVNTMFLSKAFEMGLRYGSRADAGFVLHFDVLGALLLLQVLRLQAEPAAAGGGAEEVAVRLGEHGYRPGSPRPAASPTSLCTCFLCSSRQCTQCLCQAPGRAGFVGVPTLPRSPESPLWRQPARVL